MTDQQATDWHKAAWRVLRDDIHRALERHRRNCVQCSPDGCGFVLGLSMGYDIVEARLSPTREPLL